MSKKKFQDIIKDSNAFITGLIGTISALIGLIVLYRNNSELFVLVVTVITFCLIFTSCLYLINAKNASKKYKFPRARKWAGFFLIATTVIMIGVFSSTSTQKFVTVAIYGTPTNTPTSTPEVTPTFSPTATPIPGHPNIKTILVGKRENINTIEITIHNPSAQDIIATHIKVRATEDLIPHFSCICDFPACGEFTISNQISLTGENNSQLQFRSETIRETGTLAGYEFPASGTALFGCGIYTLELNFDSSLIIPANSYYVFLVNVPSKFEVAESWNGFSEKPDRIYFPLYPPTPESPFKPTDIAIITEVELTLDSGETISASLRQ